MGKQLVQHNSKQQQPNESTNVNVNDQSRSDFPTQSHSSRLSQISHAQLVDSVRAILRNRWWSNEPLMISFVQPPH
jgi:hypothetical protein